VGDLRVGIVHGDATSLSGWAFARENLQTEAQRAALQPWFDDAEVDVFASSHTCAPIFSSVPGGKGRRWVLNNGAAGMPNLQGDAAGLFTRIAVKPFKGPELRHSVQWGRVHMEAIAITVEQDAWLTQFQQHWPSGSDAHTSYFDRITLGSHCALPSTIALEN